MKINKLLSIVLSPFVPSAAFAEQVDDPDGLKVETTQMKFRTGKNLQYFLSIRAKFSKFAKSGEIKFSSVVLIPWAVSQAALPDSRDWDAVWVEFSPNAGCYANTLSYYQKMEKPFGLILMQ